MTADEKPTGTEESIRVAVVVVANNGERWIPDCLESTRTARGVVEVIVVDNGSRDSTVELIRQRFPEVTLIEVGHNAGFGVGNNVGIRRALKRDDLTGIFLLNQDASLDESTIETLSHASKSHPEVAILAPVHLNREGAVHRGFAKYIAMDCVPFLTDCYRGEVKTFYPFRCIPASLWYLPLDTIDQIGGFDPLFFLYCEDSDYVERVYEAGKTVGVVPAARAYHDDAVAEGGGREQSLPWKQARLALSQHLIGLKYSQSFWRDFFGVFRNRLAAAAGSLVGFRLPAALGEFRRIFEVVARVPAVLRSRKERQFSIRRQYLVD